MREPSCLRIRLGESRAGLNRDALRFVLKHHPLDEKVEIGEKRENIPHPPMPSTARVLLGEDLGDDESEREDVRRLPDAPGVLLRHLLRRQAQRQ